MEHETQAPMYTNVLSSIIYKTKLWMNLFLITLQIYPDYKTN